MSFDMSGLSPAAESGDESSDDESFACFSDARDSGAYGNDGVKSIVGASGKEQLDSLWSRSIVHLDVDCFYCQCEELDGPPDYKDRPIAIGQKHIIVTSNYVARREGVKKLQSRTDAKLACPNLLILEGSDLERYREHSRRIYNTFRRALKSVQDELSTPPIPACKGGFDEMFADLSAAIDAVIRRGVETRLLPNAYVFGESAEPGHTVSITEDQSGATSIIGHATREEPSEYSGHIGGLESQKRMCSRRLHIASILAEKVRCTIKEQTGFTTTVGVAVSPMLAKLASDLKKPNSINILYPWRSSTLILPMPLRKVPELGHRTLSVLKTCLQENHVSEPKFWTCRHLLQVPQSAVLQSIKTLKSCSLSSRLQCELLLQKCRGVDTSLITDDNGGLNKTVSVENSFRRGTVMSREAVWDGMTDLFKRLPRLLDQRKAYSQCPDRAFPSTIRVTARVVDNQVQKRRPFVTKSKQCEFNGKLLMNVSDASARSKMLQRAVSPLLNSLIFQGDKVNVTRLNIGLTNFADIQSNEASNKSLRTRSVAELLASTPSIPNDKTDHGRSLTRNRKGGNLENLDGGGSAHRVESSKVASTSSKREAPLRNDLDLDVLAELPPHIAKEVRLHYGLKAGQKTQRTIDNFFVQKNT